MTEGAVHGVDLQAVDEICVGRRHGIIDPWSMALHGSVQRAHGDVHFHAWWSSVGVGRHEAQQGQSDSSDRQHQQRDHYTQNEFLHEGPRRTTKYITWDAGGVDAGTPYLERVRGSLFWICFSFAQWAYSASGDAQACGPGCQHRGSN